MKKILFTTVLAGLLLTACNKASTEKISPFSNNEARPETSNSATNSDSPKLSE